MVFSSRRVDNRRLANENVSCDRRFAKSVRREASVRPGVRKRRPVDLELNNPLTPASSKARLVCHFDRIAEPSDTWTRKTANRAR